MKLLLVGIMPLNKENHQGWLTGLELLSTSHKMTRELGKVGEDVVPHRMGFRSHINPWFT